MRFTKPMFEKIGLHKKKIITGVVFISLFLASTAGSYFFFSLSKAVVDSQESETESAEVEITLQEGDVSNSFNVLLLGYGGAGHDGGNLSDSIIVANIAPDAGQIALISVPRDLWVKVPTRSDKSTNYKINAAYAIGSDDIRYPLKEPKYKDEAGHRPGEPLARSGGGELAKEVVSEVVGMSIEYFVAIDFEGVKSAIDTLGGIEVDVPVAFDDYFYPVKGLENETCGFGGEEIDEFHANYSGFQLEKQFECRYEHLYFDAGKQVMSGEKALKFVRSRHSEQHGGDFARSARQMAVLFAVKDKILSLGFLDDASAFFNKFADTITTDIDAQVVGEIVKIYPSLSEFQISTVNLSEENVLYSSKSSNGQFILVPRDGVGNWEGVQKYIQKELGFE